MKMGIIDLEMCEIKKSFRPSAKFSREVIQIGAVKMDDEGKVTDSFSSFVRPQYGYVSQKISDLTGIRPKDTCRAPSFNEVIKMLDDFFKECSVIISWSKADPAQLVSEIKIKGTTGFVVEAYEWVDAQELFTKELSRCLEKNISRRFALELALNIANIDFAGRLHQAHTDALYTAILYYQMMNHALRPNRYYIDIYEGKETSIGNPLKDLLDGFRFCFNANGELLAVT